MPKDESEPISPDETLIRCLLKSDTKMEDGRHRPAVGGFSIRKSDTDGISLWRRDCGATPEAVINRMSNPFDWAYFLIPANIILEMKFMGENLSVLPTKDDSIPGHCVITQFTPDNTKGEKRDAFRHCREMILSTCGDVEFVSII